MTKNSERKTLRDFIFDRSDLIQQTIAATDEVVARQRGATGLALRAAYKMARGLAPNMMETIVEELLEEFLDALTPFYHEALERNVPIDRYILGQRRRVAVAMLTVTDRRERAERPGKLKAGYRTLRPQAIARLEDAAPELGKLLKNNIPAEFRPGEARAESGTFAVLT